MKNKWHMISMILTGITAITGILAGVVGSKEMEFEIDAALDRRLNPDPVASEEEEEVN